MILEREDELEQLRRLLDDIDSSGGRVVLVRGEAGIGKSALVTAFAAESENRAHVLIGGCDDLLIPQPLGPFWDMARVEPSLKIPLDGGERAQVLEVAFDLLSRSLRPTIIIIEDVHWADEATLDAIKYLGRRVAGTNGLILLTYRDGEVDNDHPLRGVIGDIPAGSVARIQLRGLSLSAVTSLLIGSALDPDEVLRATDGNPFLVTEMASAEGASVPPSLEDSVMARVGKLSTGAQKMLETLSVIPEPIPRPDALGLRGVDEGRLAEGGRHGLLNLGDEQVTFRHDLIRRTIESTLTDAERLAKNQMVLDDLPKSLERTHPCLLIHCAVGAKDVDRLLVLAPRSARYAATMGSHVQSVEDFREMKPHLDQLAPEDLGPLLEEWASEELFVDNVVEAMELAEAAIEHYRARDDRRGESRALARAAHYAENAGLRHRAEDFARLAIDVLGPNPERSDLARALEASAYLQTMAGNVQTALDLVERTLEAAGSDGDPQILIRSLNHRGVVANIANYPDGRESLDEAARRAAAAGQWYEESRALFNQSWAAVEARDLPTASDYVQRAIASAARHELPTLEKYAEAMYARVLELKGDWTRAEDLATGLLDGMALSQMVAFPVLGGIAGRRGKAAARSLLDRSWEMANRSRELQRLAPTAIAFAEYAWISGDTDVPVSEFKAIMTTELDKGFRWSPGSIAFWLWKLGELSEAPEGIAEPYRLVMEGRSAEAAAVLDSLGLPYERALALMDGDTASQLEALDALDTLGATAVAGRLRKSMRDRGLRVPRGPARSTRGHAVGLTARQAEVLGLLADGLTNAGIADRLFISLRTVENHVAAILMKLDVATRDAAVAAARDRGALATG